MNITVEIATASKEWSAYPEIDSALCGKITSMILSRYVNLKKVKQWELSILLIDDANMQELNAKFRQKDKVTNVLSFPDFDIKWDEIVDFVPDDKYMYLGDVAFGYTVIMEEAKQNSIKFIEHFQHLLVHAILHLIGYNHLDEDEAVVMESIETLILDELGVKSPY